MSLNAKKPEPKYKSIDSIGRCVIYLVESTEKYRGIIRSIKPNIEYTLDQKKRLEFYEIFNTLCLVGRGDPVEDFDQGVLDKVRSFMRNQGRLFSKHVIFIDCTDFQEKAHFDAVINNRRKIEGSPFEYLCINTTESSGRNCSMTDTIENCIACNKVASGCCDHSCIKNFIGKL